MVFFKIKVSLHPSFFSHYFSLIKNCGLLLFDLCGEVCTCSASPRKWVSQQSGGTVSISRGHFLSWIRLILTHHEINSVAKWHLTCFVLHCEIFFIYSLCMKTNFNSKNFNFILWKLSLASKDVRRSLTKSTLDSWEGIRCWLCYHLQHLSAWGLFLTLFCRFRSLPPLFCNEVRNVGFDFFFFLLLHFFPVQRRTVPLMLLCSFCASYHFFF